MTDAQLTGMPQHHTTHYNSVANSCQSMADNARTIEKALQDMWKARDGLPYLETKLQEKAAFLDFTRIGEHVDSVWVDTVKQIGDLLQQILVKRTAFDVARKQLCEAREELINSQSYLIKYQCEVPGTNDPLT